MAQPPGGESGAPSVGVPLVDLTATVEGLRQHASETRRQRDSLLAWAHRYAASMERCADYLDSLADVLSGTPT